MRYNELKEGMQVVADVTIHNNVGDSYAPGFVFTVLEQPEDGTLLLDDDYVGTWFYFEFSTHSDNKDVNFSLA